MASTITTQEICLVTELSTKAGQAKVANAENLPGFIMTTIRNGKVWAVIQKDDTSQ